jgi:hypothetical protein
VKTFAQSDFGLFGEQRLTLEPALLAVMLAGGVGTFMHYDLPNSARMLQVPTWGAVSMLERKELAPVASVTSGLQIPLSFGARTPQVGTLPSPAAVRSSEPEISTATLLNKRPVTSESFLSRLNGSASRQDYVIRLTFPEPAAVDLAVVAKPSPPQISAVVREALPINEPGPATASLDLTNDGFAASGASPLDPAAVVGIQTARLAELQSASVVEPQGFAGVAVLQLDGSKFDLALIPKSAPGAGEPRAAGKNLAAKPHAANRTGLNLSNKQDRLVGEFIFHRTGVQLNDSPAGNVDVRIGGDTSLSIQVGALLSIVEGQLDPGVFAAMRASASAGEYVSFGEIRAAGIDVRYDAAADQIVLTAD